MSGARPAATNIVARVAESASNTELARQRHRCMCNVQHLADAAAAFDARRGSYDTQLEEGEGTTLTARAACGCGHSPTSSPRSLGRAAAPAHTSVLCHTPIRMRVIPYVAQFLSKIN